MTGRRGVVGAHSRTSAAPMRMIVGATMTLLLAACAPIANDGGGMPADDAALVGTPAVTGSSPVDQMVTLVDSSGGNIRLRGALADEIAQLVGADVAVWGEREADAVRVTRYRLLAVGGRPAIMGTVERTPDGSFMLRTREGRVVVLSGSASALRPGMTAWVQGPETVRVESYGIVTP